MATGSSDDVCLRSCLDEVPSRTEQIYTGYQFQIKMLAQSAESLLLGVSSCFAINLLPQSHQQLGRYASKYFICR